MATTTLCWRPSDDPHPRARTDNGEAEFYDLLRAQRYDFEIEPHTYPLPPHSGRRTARGLTPDVWLNAIGGWVLNPDGPKIYLELTAADRYIDQGALPLAIRRKNRRQSQSQREYISPEDYLRRKQRKIAQAVALYPNLVVLLVPYYQQLSILDHPEDLLLKLEEHLVARGLWRAAHAHPTLTSV